IQAAPTGGTSKWSAGRGQEASGEGAGTCDGEGEAAYAAFADAVSAITSDAAASSDARIGPTSYPPVRRLRRQRV
ncbi:MAG: hypothetical protein LH650_11680, partial [Chloroflexi bacterium]|nr:hypothetical protein [Chloroflexota bacterium]